MLSVGLLMICQVFSLFAEKLSIGGLDKQFVLWAIKLSILTPCH